MQLNSTAISQDELDLIERAQRIKREVFQENQALVNWQQVSIDLHLLRERVVLGKDLSRATRKEWLTWINTWERYAKAGSLFRVDPCVTQMLRELERLDVEIFLAAERKINWSTVWEHRVQIHSLIHKLPLTLEPLRDLGYRHFDQLVNKAKGIFASRSRELGATSAGVSARICSTLTDVGSQRIVPRPEDIALAPRMLSQLLKSPTDQRRSATVYNELYQAQESSRQVLMESAKDLRRLWQGLIACKPLLLQEHRDLAFTKLQQLQKDLHAVWKLWLRSWGRIREARLRSLKVGGATSAERLDTRMHYLLAELAHKQGRILEIESQYEWSDNNVAKKRFAIGLQRTAAEMRNLKVEIKTIRQELHGLRPKKSASENEL